VNTKVPEEDLLRVMAKMTEEPFPLLNWIGYNSSFLISSAQSRIWTIAISEEPVMRVLPRRWLDIFGSKISDVWEAALKAVVGTLVFRPGISQVLDFVLILSSLNAKQTIIYRSKYIGDSGRYTTGKR
jgi:oxalate---CoA ligase